MSTYYKVLVGLIGAVYFISPVDLIPDLLLPYVGWLDDAFLVGVIIYYIKNGRLPGFLKNTPLGRSFGKNPKFSFFNQNKEPFFSKQSGANHQSRGRSGQNQGRGKSQGNQANSHSRTGFSSSHTSGNAFYSRENHHDQSGSNTNFNKKSNTERTSSSGRRDSTAQGKAKRAKTPHEVLGVPPNASKEEILSAYRKAVKAYHPDRVAHLGKDLQELANQRFIEIREAYMQLTKKMG